MTHRCNFIAILLIILLACVAGNAGANTASGGPPGSPANAIVGTWEFTVQLGPCNGPLNPAFRAMTVFHMGGTLSESNATPLVGVPSPWGLSQRGPAYGSWRYDPTSGRYTAQMRFYWFVNGVLHGHQLIERQLTVAGDQMDGTITAERHFVDGTIPTAHLCGIESGVRVF
jgi:hypothetical protein